MTLTPTSWTEPPVPPAFEDQNGFMLPAGTVTLLLADMEGSVRAWERDRDAMTEAVGRLDRLVDDTVGRYGGVRPEQQGEGDSFVAAFARASDAVAAALELQLALAGGEWVALPLRLRMGLHTGEVQLRDEANYVDRRSTGAGGCAAWPPGARRCCPPPRAAESAGPVERCWVAASSSGCPTPLSVGAAALLYALTGCSGRFSRTVARLRGQGGAGGRLGRPCHLRPHRPCPLVRPERHRRAVIFTDDQQHDSGDVRLDHVPLIYTFNRPATVPRRCPPVASQVSARIPPYVAGIAPRRLEGWRGGGGWRAARPAPGGGPGRPSSGSRSALAPFAAG